MPPSIVRIIKSEQKQSSSDFFNPNNFSATEGKKISKPKQLHAEGMRPNL